MMDRSISLETIARRYPHLMMVALMGKTAEHLREVHGVAPADDWRERPESKWANAAAHLAAHRPTSGEEQP